MSPRGIPEDRLLDLIRTGRHTLDEHEAQSPGRLAQMAAGIRRMACRIDWMSWMNWFVRGLIVTAAVLFLLTLAMPRPLFAPDGRKKASLGAADTVSAPLAAGEGFEGHLAAVRASNLFDVPAAKTADLAAAAEDGLNAYTLVGILVEDPVQAILKNKKSGVISYLKQGDSLGDIRVAEILEGKIIVEYRGERFEVHL